MAGQIKRIIDKIIQDRSDGNPTLAVTTSTKLVLKGVNPKAYDATSPDDPDILAKLKTIAAEMGVKL